MSLVTDLPAIFDQFSEARQKGFLTVMDLKERGIPLVGTYCTFMPQELPMAAGAVVVSLCSTSGEKPLKTPEDLAKHTLLHDASRRDWQTYTRQLGLNHINVQQGPIFSHSAMVLQAAIHGQGVALANNVMAQSEIEAGRLVCPFNDVLVSKNAFYLVCHDSQAELGKIAAFRQWILAKAAAEQEKFRFRYEQ